MRAQWKALYLVLSSFLIFGFSSQGLAADELETLAQVLSAEEARWVEEYLKIFKKDVQIQREEKKVGFINHWTHEIGPYDRQLDTWRYTSGPRYDYGGHVFVLANRIRSCSVKPGWVGMTMTIHLRTEFDEDYAIEKAVNLPRNLRGYHDTYRWTEQMEKEIARRFLEFLKSAD